MIFPHDLGGRLMASGDQIKALLKSYLDGDDTHFFALVVQVAAHEARLDHGKLAEELCAMVDEANGGLGRCGPYHRPPAWELANLLEASYPKVRLTR